MPRVGITGHMGLTPETAQLVAKAISSHLDTRAPHDLVGVSCLAAGADSIFATAVLEAGGTLEVILPAVDYRARKVKPEHAPLFDSLLARATTVQVMPYAEAGRAAYEAANAALVLSVDELLAVWDGQPSTGRGGTADVVAFARANGVPVHVIWPSGAQRG